MPGPDTGRPEAAAETAAGKEAGERPAVRMVEVRKRFGERTVLERMDLSVDLGEKLVIIGPSGSGKTTILRLIMTLETPDHGRIEVDGELLGCAWEEGRVVGDNRRNLRRVRRQGRDGLPALQSLSPPERAG